MLISEAYAAQQRELHATGTYGTVGEHFGGLVSQIVDRLEVTHLLDYGCGSRMSLTKGLKIKPGRKLTYQGYDPGAGREELATAPIPAQMVCCIDVLEHIEPDYLDNVLKHLQELTEVVAFVTVHTGPAMKTLPDGRNAHLTQEPIEWWLNKLTPLFDIQSLQKTDDHSYYMIFYAKPLQIQTVEGEKAAAQPIITEA